MLLRMEQISKAFFGVSVLSNVDFDLRPGEVHILAGENGAGKTTLIKILAGAHTDYDGRIVLHDSPVRFRNPHDAMRYGIAVIHQDSSLIPSMSVADNLRLGRERATKDDLPLLGEMGLSLDPCTYVEDLPPATRQLVEIAKALGREARIFVMDEPTSALNDIEAQKLFDHIQRFKERGCGIIYITHRMEEIYRLADRITVLRDGCVAGSAPAGELPPAKLVQWMIGRTLSGQFPQRRATIGAPLFEIRSLRVRNPRDPARLLVDDVSMILHAGEILGLAGLEGAGKSELLHALFGDAAGAASGEVSIEGRRTDLWSPREAMRQGVALVTNDRQRFGIVPDLNVVHNLTLATLGRYSRGGWLRSRAERQTADNLVRDLRIKARYSQPVRTLSGGNQQKVVLGKWLETHPRVMLLDEPTRGVDVGAKHEIYEMMNRWTQEGMGILLITSEMSELLAMADNIVVMHRGRITGRYSRDEATQDRIMAAAMGQADGVEVSA